MKSVRALKEHYPADSQLGISAEIISVIENTKEIVVRIQKGLTLNQNQDIIVVSPGRTSWKLVAYKVVDNPVNIESGTVVTIKEVGDDNDTFVYFIKGGAVTIFALPEETADVAASVSLMVVPREDPSTEFGDADTAVTVAGGVGAGKKKLKKKGYQAGGVDILTQGVPDSEDVLVKPDQDAAVRILAESLQGQINSEGGVAVEDLADQLHGFEVKHAQYLAAVKGYSTITNVFSLDGAVLAQWSVAGVDRDRDRLRRYIDMNREDLQRVRALAHNNAKPVTSERFNRAEIEPELLKIRGILKRQKKLIRGGEQSLQLDEGFENPAPMYPMYFASVFDRDGNAVIGRALIDSVLTTRTGSDLGCRLVLMDENPYGDVFWRGYNKQRKRRLSNLFVIIEERKLK